MSYEEIRIPQELSESVQRAVGMAPRRHGTLEELVKDVAAQRGVRRPENLISEQPTRHEVRVNGEALYTYCFVDALMLPFVVQGERFEVRSESPISVGGEVTALVTKNSVEASPADAIVSFGAVRAGDGPVQASSALTSTPSPPERSTRSGWQRLLRPSHSPSSPRGWPAAVEERVMTVGKRRNPGPVYHRTWHKNIGTLPQEVTE